MTSFMTDACERTIVIYGAADETIRKIAKVNKIKVWARSNGTIDYFDNNSAKIRAMKSALIAAGYTFAGIL